MEKVDIAIIGAGVIGLAASFVLSKLGKEIIVIEKNPSFGQEASSRNSEVIHAGIYYPKGSLKSEVCIKGKGLLYDLCSRYNIPHRKFGKLIVASGKEGISKLNNIYKNAMDCGVKSVKFLDKKDARKLEPDIEGEAFLFSPETGIVDSHSLMKFFFQVAKKSDADFIFSTEVIGIKKAASFYEVVVKEPHGGHFSFRAKAVINAAGCWSDKICALVGIDPEESHYRIKYCKGQYFRIRNPKKFSITRLIYPPPTDRDLGIHITPDLAGELRLGPDAKYVKDIEYNVDEGEKGIFFASVSKFLPALKENDLIPDTAGIRSKLQSEGEGFRDFVIKDEKEKGFPDFINLIGIESPGLTGSLAIAERVLSCLSIH